MNKVICIVGPTASGKTKLSVELAKRINAEIISADSMQIYKGLDIATAKVTSDQMQGVKHHLIDICNTEEKFSVADFKNMCYDKIHEIQSSGKNVIVVGGTGLYINSIVYDLDFSNEDVDLEYRQSLYELAAKNSNEYVYEMLKSIDPVTAKDLHPNNLKRVVRALEIARNTSKLKSEHIISEKERIASLKSKYEFYIFSIDYPRDILYERINKRVDIMIEDGLIEEAKSVYNMHLQEDNTCMQAIGYKELFPYIEGIDTLENVASKLKQNTRNYAKRQLTWFKNKLDVHYLDYALNVDDMIKEIIQISNI